MQKKSNKLLDNYLNVTCFFPYPSGDGLHIGHVYNYAIMDSYCRYKRYIGLEVFQPFGYDAFGLPAENYARKVGGDPKTITLQNIENFRTQMKAMDTEYEELLITCSESYQEITQFIFNILLKRGLAYKAKGKQQYCPSCETVLAREQVQEGKCERCKTTVEQKELEQWYFKTTAYKDRLIANLDWIDYPEKTLNAQRAWLENLHDWCVSRQRSWGCPIPIEGETDTLDTFVDSSFYYLIYQVARNANKILKSGEWWETPWFDLKPVDLYVGGSEHACMHLIYARFICMVLYDEGIVNFEEPFKKVIHQGMILKDGEKMSKGRGNVISPDGYKPNELRLYLMFIGHYFDGGSWNDNNFKGIPRFIRRFSTWLDSEGTEEIDIESFKEKIFNFTEAFKFNKVVSEFMILYNSNKSKKLKKEQIQELKELFNIYAPNTF